MKWTGIVLLAVFLLLAGAVLVRGFSPYFWPGPNRVAAAEFGSPNPGPWYKGDLHAHSLFSDGANTVAAHMDRAERMGLDFYCLTDHDNWPFLRGTPHHWGSPQYRSDRLTLFYGMEWTTNKGHANVWSARPFDYAPLWRDNLHLDADAAISHAHERDAVFSINHPTSTTKWRYPIDTMPDSIEVWHSAFYMPDFSGYAVWDGLLRAGHRVTGVGGGDAHTFRPNCLYGTSHRWRSTARPTTWICAPRNDADSLLDAIRAGHVAISYAPEGPRLELAADTNNDGIYSEAMMGDAVPVQQTPVSFQVRVVEMEPMAPTAAASVRPLDDAEVAGLVAGTKTVATIQSEVAAQGGVAFDLLLVYKDGVVSRAAALLGAANTYTFAETPDQPHYYRVEMLRLPTPNPGDGSRQYGVTAMTNPIYFVAR